MNAETTTPKTALSEGAKLRASAIGKLNLAERIIDEACAALCNLEGPGYCDHYEKAGKLSQRVQALSKQIQRLNPPTGVFKI